MRQFAADTKRQAEQELELQRREFPRFFDNALMALGAEPQRTSQIHGASGVVHDVIASGMDETRRRLILVSAETNARAAALAQADIQAGIENLRVLMARPVIVSAAELASEIVRVTGRETFGAADLKIAVERNRAEVQANIETTLEPITRAIVPWVNNATSLRSFKFLQGLRQFLEQLAEVQWSTEEGKPWLDLRRPFGEAPAIGDERYGICAWPVFAFSEDQMACIDAGADMDEVRAILRQHDVLQYFFPGADQLALGIADRAASTPEQLKSGLELAPRLGHPYGPNELLPADVRVQEVVEALRQDYLVEGELSFEVSSDGETARASVRFRPKEGVISKVLNRMSVVIDVGRFLGGGP